MSNFQGKLFKCVFITIVIGIIISIALLIERCSLTDEIDFPEMGSENTSSFNGVVLTYAPEDNAHVTEEDLKVYSELIIFRLRVMGYTDAVIIENDGRLLVEIPNIKNFDKGEELVKRPVPEFSDARGNILLDAYDIRYATCEIGKLTDNSKGYRIAVNFTGEGAEKLKEATKQISDMAPDNQMIITVDGKNLASPSVYGASESGVLYIEGNYSETEAKSITTLINASVLPFEMKLKELATNPN